MLKNMAKKFSFSLRAFIETVSFIFAISAIIAVLGCICYSHYWNGKYHQHRFKHEHNYYLKLEAGEKTETQFGPCPGC